LGKSATGTFELTVTLPGQKPQRFEKLPCGSKEFSRLEWLGFMSNANRSAVAQLDNLCVEPVR
jgi:hypothetical protein